MLYNKKGETNPWGVVATILIVIVICVVILLFISDNVRGAMMDLVGLKPSEESVNLARCEDACDTAKMRVTNCDGPEWNSLYCNVKYNNSLSCSSAEIQQVISKCVHQTGNTECACA